MIGRRTLADNPVRMRALASLALLGLALTAGGAPAATNDQPALGPRRLLVKLREPLASEAEASLRPGANAIETAGVSHVTLTAVSSFVSRYGIARLAPLYPEMVRAKLQSHSTGQQLAERLRGRFAQRASRFRGVFQPPDISRTYIVELSGNPPDQAGTLKLLRADANVEYAEEEKTYKSCDLPNDPYLRSSGSWGQSYADLWGIYKINAPTAWGSSTGRGIVVAVVDSGIDLTHPDIAANIWVNTKEIPGNGVDDDGNGYVDDTHGWNFVAQNNDPTDDFGHGTHVAGTIAAVGNNGIGVIGVAWQSQVMALKGLDSTGNGQDSQLAPAIVYAANQGADVLSLSWGDASRSETIADAIDYAYSMGIVIVAAAGNQETDARGFYPAALWDVITVAASDPNDNLADFSNFGSKIDVAAPGVDILSLQAAGTTLGTPAGSGGYTRLKGTSMATPHVSGLAALLLALHPEYSNEDVRQAIRASAQGVADGVIDLSFGYGHADAAQALTLGGVLECKIGAPSDGVTVRSQISISGVARGNGFAGYTLEYGSGTQPAAWTTLQSGTAPVSGTLGGLDATTLPNGTYTIRLTAYNATGQKFVDRIEVVAAPVAISSPAPPDFPTAATTIKPGTSIPISGSAVATGFRAFHVEWARGINPVSGWKSDGVVLADGGTTAVSNGLLANWYTAPITPADYYTIRLTVNAPGLTNQASTVVYLEPDLLSPNWPQVLDPGPWTTVGVVPALNADGSTRLLLEPINWGPPQSQVPLWTLPLDAPAQRTLLDGNGTSSQVAVASFDGKPGEEAVFVEAAHGASGSSLGVLRPDGSTFSSLPAPNVRLGPTQPVIAHLRADDPWDIVAVAEGGSAGSPAYLFAWRPDGTLVGPNFPIGISNQYGSQAQPYNGVRTIAGDVDGDGANEIVAIDIPAPSNYTLKLFANDGAQRIWQVPVIVGVPMAMAAADLDHNGKLETIVVSCVWDSTHSFLTQPTVHVFQPDGSERAGWPVSLTNSLVTQAYLAVGDLDRSGHEQIVLSDQQHLSVFNSDGTSYSSQWPLEAPNHNPGFGPVVIGDINGDGYPEIVVARIDLGGFTPAGLAYYSQQLLAYRRDASVARSWQLMNLNGHPVPFAAIPLIGDFDHDGITEIAVSYGLAAYGVSADVPGIVSVLSTGAPYNPSTYDWPAIYQNARNTAVLQPANGGGDPGSNAYCTYLLSANGAFFSAAGGSSAVSVTTTPACQWTVSNTANWITLSENAGRTGSATVAFTLPPNTGAARSATIAIANRTFKIDQESASSNALPFAGSMAQIASGGGWDTSVTLVNSSSKAADALLEFLGNDGRDLNLPFTSPQGWLTGTVLGSTLAATIQSNALLSFNTSGPLNLASQEGALHLLSGGNVNGFAIFTYTPSGQAAVVPLETGTASSYLLSFDNTGNLETGLAISNLAPTGAAVGVTLRDDSGAQIGSGTIQIDAEGHRSFMMNDATYGFPAAANKRGTIEFDTPASGRIGVLGLRTNLAALTTLPVLTSVGSGGGALAHVAFGGGWQTLMTLVNMGTAEAQATLEFLDDAGNLLELPLLFPQTGVTKTASSLTLSLSAGSSMLIQTQAGSGQPARVGSAQLTASGSVGGFAIFQNAGQEAVVPLESGDSVSRMLIFDNTNNLATGIALTNGTALPANVAATLRDESGNVLGTSTIHLLAWGHMSQMLTQLFPASANIRGTVEFDGPDDGRIYSLGIRATPSAEYTSIPAISKDR